MTQPRKTALKGKISMCTSDSQGVEFIVVTVRNFVFAMQLAISVVQRA
jgi:hypothetical protein